MKETEKHISPHKITTNQSNRPWELRKIAQNPLRKIAIRRDDLKANL
ncbi:hypothetical protein [Flagellimonas onchidii]|nr:hypothetical protein [Allomuricauda onchidii]